MAGAYRARKKFLQGRHGPALAAIPSSAAQPFDTAPDVSICSDQPRTQQDADAHPEPIPVAGAAQESDTQSPLDEFFVAKHPQDAKRSRQAEEVGTHLSMEHHGWKQSGAKSAAWSFEHRWPHLRDRAEGRNHRPQGN